MTKFQMGTALILASLLLGVVVAASAPGSGNPESRYQIVQALKGAAWRLDTQTGEVTPCRMTVGGPICRAAEPPQVAAVPEGR